MYLCEHDVIPFNTITNEIVDVDASDYASSDEEKSSDADDEKEDGD